MKTRRSLRKSFRMLQGEVRRLWLFVERALQLLNRPGDSACSRKGRIWIRNGQKVFEAPCVQNKAGLHRRFKPVRATFLQRHELTLRHVGGQNQEETEGECLCVISECTHELQRIEYSTAARKSRRNGRNALGGCRRRKSQRSFSHLGQKSPCSICEKPAMTVGT